MTKLKREFKAVVGVLGASKQQTLCQSYFFHFFFFFCVISSVIRSASQFTEEDEEL